jgi:hypothetical protein
MPYGTIGASLGIGSYVGEIRQGPDGQLYEWVEGVDGLGNPIGFWRGLRKLASSAINVAKRAAGGVLPLLARFIPPPIKGIARRVCNFLPQIGPVISQVPDAAGPYRMANKFCGVLRSAGIAEVPAQVPFLPNLSHLVPSPVRGAARAVCGMVNKLAPIVRFIPPVRPYAAGASTICSILKNTGIAGADGLMQGADGQLYEVVEGIGEFGERRRMAVPVNIIIPAHIRRRRHHAHRRHHLRPGVVAQPGLRPGIPMVPMQPGVQPVMPVAMPTSVRRFR